MLQRRQTDMEKNTSESVCAEPPHGAHTGLTAVGRTMGLSLASGVALVGNLLVLIVIKRNPSTRPNIIFFIVNMAASDLLLPIVGLPFHLMNILLGPARFLIGGPLGEVLCKLVRFMAYISLSVSIQSLILIAVERFVAVVYPLKMVKFSPRCRTRLIVVTWIVAAVFNSPILFYRRLKSTCNGIYCVIDWAPLSGSHVHTIYSGVLVNLMLALPLLVIACLYTAILIKLKRMKVPGARNSQPDPQGSRRRERNKNITKMSACIVVAFALCYLPTYFDVMFSTSPRLIKLVALNLAYTNGAMNPLILFYFCTSFRRALRDMFRCNSCCCKTSDRVAEQDVELQVIDGNALENWIGLFACENYCRFIFTWEKISRARIKPVSIPLFPVLEPPFVRARVKLLAHSGEIRHGKIIGDNLHHKKLCACRVPFYPSRTKTVR